MERVCEPTRTLSGMPFTILRMPLIWSTIGRLNKVNSLTGSIQSDTVNQFDVLQQQHRDLPTYMRRQIQYDRRMGTQHRRYICRSRRSILGDFQKEELAAWSLEALCERTVETFELQCLCSAVFTTHAPLAFTMLHSSTTDQLHTKKIRGTLCCVAVLVCSSGAIE
jgi:hypothetical protein